MPDRVRLLRNASGIPYSLRQGYPTFKMSDEGVSAVEEYVINLDDMNAFYLLSMPPPIVFGDNVQLFNRRNMPGTLNLPTKNLEFRPLADDLPQDPFGVDPPGYNNPYLIAKINYETNPINSGGGVDPADPTTFLEVSFDATAEFLKIPSNKTNFVTAENATAQGRADRCGGSLNADADRTAAGNNVEIEVKANEANIDTEVPTTILIPTTTYTVTWKLALNPNFALFRSLIGRVNTFTDPLFFDAPPETILFVGYSGSRSFLWDGEGETTITPWNLTFKFIGKHVEDADGAVYGWQHIYRPSSGAFMKVLRANLNYLYNCTTTWGPMFRAGGLI